MSDKFKVNCNGILGAIIQNGIFKGLPFGLAMHAMNGSISLEEIEKRGWEVWEQ
jgi:hypothetical protein